MRTDESCAFSPIQHDELGAGNSCSWSRAAHDCINLKVDRLGSERSRFAFHE
jgi:hypothetical protein